MNTTFSNRKYIIHFKVHIGAKTLFNLSENELEYSVSNPISYSSKLNVTPLNKNDMDITDYGIGFTKNSTGYSPFINVSNISSYIEENEDFTFYFRITPTVGGLNYLTLDLFNTTYPGNSESSSAQYFKFGIYDKKLQFICNAKNSFSFAYDISSYIPKKQYHIALSRCSNVIRAYIDGKKVYDSYDTGNAFSYFCKDAIFYDSVNKRTLNVYLGSNKSNQTVYFDDFTICKGFALYRYFDFTVPEDVLAPKELERHSKGERTFYFDTSIELPVHQTYKTSYFCNKSVVIKALNERKIKSDIAIVHFDTNIVLPIYQTYTTFYNLVRSSYLENTTERENKSTRHIYTKSKRFLKQYRETYIKVRYNNVINITSIDLTVHSILKNVETIQDSTRTVEKWKRKTMAFIINPKFQLEKRG